MGTWFPFPIWYFLSPEGVGVVTSGVIIQMGWAYLNITAKFTLAFYIQRIKDNYCNRLKVKREMKGETRQINEFGEVEQDDGEGGLHKVNGELSACVCETMNFMGMAENIDRFVRLLNRAKIFSLEDIAKLTKEDCEELQLPHDLISSLQKRSKVWNLEMQDDAERGLEKSEKHYHVGEKNMKPKMPQYQNFDNIFA